MTSAIQTFIKKQLRNTLLQTFYSLGFSLIAAFTACGNRQTLFFTDNIWTIFGLLLAILTFAVSIIGGLQGQVINKLSQKLYGEYMAHLKKLRYISGCALFYVVFVFYAQPIFLQNFGIPPLTAPQTEIWAYYISAGTTIAIMAYITLELCFFMYSTIDIYCDLLSPNSEVEVEPRKD